MKENKKNENLVKEYVTLGKFFELATSDKIYVNNLNLHEFKKENLLDYKGDFELNGSMIIGPFDYRTNTRLKNMDDFESYINAIDIDYDSEAVTFTGYVYNLNTPQFNVVKRIAHAKGTNYMHEIVEYHGKNCYIHTYSHCFLKCNNYLSGKDYTEEFFTFIRTEKY